MGPSGGNDEMKIRSGMLATKFVFRNPITGHHIWKPRLEPLEFLAVAKRGSIVHACATPSPKPVRERGASDISAPLAYLKHDGGRWPSFLRAHADSVSVISCSCLAVAVVILCVGAKKQERVPTQPT